MDAFLSRMQDDCRVHSDGELMIGEEAISSVDLTGDGQLEVMLNTEFLRCSTVPVPPYCGTGGCALFAYVGDDVHEWQAYDWHVMTWEDEPILILMRDGGWCGAGGATHCFEALFWNGGRFLSVMPPAE